MNILITGSWSQAKEYIPQIEDMNHKVVFLQYEKDALPCDYSWPEAIIFSNIFKYHTIDKFCNLKYLQSTSAGTDHLPMEYIHKHDIKFNNAKGVYSIPIAEFAVSSILQIYKHSKYFYENQKNKIWEKDRSLEELTDKKVCIIGCGSIGTEIAKRLKAFNCYVYGIRQQNKKKDYFDEVFTYEKIYDVLEKSEIIIIACPLTSNTKHLISSEGFKHIQDGSVIVNIARGPIIDQKALRANIDRLYGVALDVFEEEPLNNKSTLWNKQNVIISPHNSFVSNKNNERLSSLILNNLKDLNDK